jgi:hypothetical protein
MVGGRLRGRLNARPKDGEPYGTPAGGETTVSSDARLRKLGPFVTVVNGPSDNA